MNTSRRRADAVMGGLPSSVFTSPIAVLEGRFVLGIHQACASAVDITVP
jgi:hypothetical protein